MRSWLAARFAPLGVVGLVGLFGACSTFGEGDTSGAHGGPPAAVADGSAGPGPAPGADAAAETGADARPDRFCATLTGTAFCSDFEGDNAGASPFGWSDAILAAGSTFTREDAVGVGGSRGLHLKVDVPATAPAMNTWLRRALGSTDMTRTFTLELDFRVAQTTASYGIFGALWFFPNSDPVLVGAATGNGPFIKGVEDPASLYAGGPILGAWHHVVSRVAPAGAGHTRLVTVNGETVATGAVAVASPLAPADLRIGFYYAGAITSLDAYFDNVVVRVE